MSAYAKLIFYLSYLNVNAFCQSLIKTLTKNKNGKNIAFNMKIYISVLIVVDFHSVLDQIQYIFSSPDFTI